MKAYNEYMDKVSVSNTLHEKIMSRTEVTPKYRPIMIRRYIAAFAYLAVVLLGVFIIPKLSQHNVAPTPGKNAPVSEPGSITGTPDSSYKYTLYFNKAEGQSAADISISGHFWQEMTDNEIEAVFPVLNDTHNIKATANFQNNENGTSLFNIDAYAISAAGLETYIQLAPGEVVLDYVFDSETKSSDVLGCTVTAGKFTTEPNSKGVKNIIYFATFKLSEVAYCVELSGTEADKEALENEISELIGLLIEGGVADLTVFHPVVPELRDDRLSLDEARADVDFGAYLPSEIPLGFVFEDAHRFINQEENVLFANWSKGMGYINWHVSLLEDEDKIRITSADNPRNYDLTLYPIPHADSVPDELREIVDNPIFLIDELTFDEVQSRTYEISDSGDEPGQRMRFSVLYEDILVELSIKGVSPEEVFDILQQIRK